MIILIIKQIEKTQIMISDESTEFQAINFENFSLSLIVEDNLYKNSIYILLFLFIIN